MDFLGTPEPKWHESDDKEKPFTKSAQTIAKESDNSSSSSPSDNDHFDGTIKLATKEAVVLIPRPTQDPQDPLNIPKWQKPVIVIIATLYSIIGLTTMASMGALLVFLIPDYTRAGKSRNEISALVTYPSLLLGVGNILSMPLALSIGRRPVFLLSNLVLFISLIACATSKSFEWHLTGRCIAGFAGAQSEALVPLILQDIFFLHQRARAFQYWSSSITIFNSSLTIAASYMTDAVGWRSWYYLLSALSATTFLLAFVFVPETAYGRPLSAYDGSSSRHIPSNESFQLNPEEATPIATTISRPPLDLINYLPRTTTSNIRIFVQKPDWSMLVNTLKHTVQLLIFPHVLWLATMNGIFAGIDTSIIITYGPILVAPPYNWAETSVSLAQIAQFPVALISVPLLGWVADKAVVFMAKRNKGIHQPEYRLLTFVFPLVLGLILTVIYGEVAQNPFRYHWMGIIFPQAVYLFLLYATNTVGLTYLLDAHPLRAGPIMVILCVFRGLISFGLSKNTVSYIENIGFSKVFGIYAGIVAFFGVLGVGVFYKGKSLRRMCARWAN